MTNTDTKAWQVTSANTHLLSLISNVTEQAFKANLGWIMVEDWSARPNRYLLMPVKVFQQKYPEVELTKLAVDEG